MIYRKLVKPLLFRVDAEKAHHLVVGGMHWAGCIPGADKLLQAMCGTAKQPELSVEVAGMHFRNPVGLAAGLDKNGQAVSAFASLGFGFLEVGTVTPKPQEGNELPRLFRLPEDEALINRMGFNNIGAAAMAENLRRTSSIKVPLAVNIGKNKTTPNEQAEDDYRQCLRQLYPYGDFFVVNISSPNTPDLRNLQHGDDLRRLLAAVDEEMSMQAGAQSGKIKPVFVKIAPDLSGTELEAIAATVLESGIAGIIATNTTVRREGLKNVNARESGGLSGRPLAQQSTDVIRSVYRLTGGRVPIIGVGGIFSARDAYEKIRSGASLVEIYTSLIYLGPAVVRSINAGLAEMLRRDGFTRVSQAVGVDA